MKLSKGIQNAGYFGVIKKVVIFILCVLCLPLIDFILINIVKQEPIFTIQTRETDYGNGMEYYGIGYKIVKCNIDGDTTSKFGFFNMNHTCKMDTFVEIETREYSHAMSSIRGIPFEIKCTKNLIVKAMMEKAVDVGTFYKDEDTKAYKEIETTCNSTFYFNPNKEVEMLEEVKILVNVIDDKNEINKVYVIDYNESDNFFRVYDDNFTIVLPNEFVNVKEKIYEDEFNSYYLNTASIGYFVSYPEQGRVRLTDALDSGIVSINQLIRRGMEIIIEEKAI